VLYTMDVAENDWGGDRKRRRSKSRLYGLVISAPDAIK
jgi:hypothetical protein